MMIKSLGSFYGILLRGMVVLAVAGAISQSRVFEAQEAARKSVKQGLVSLSKLNSKASEHSAHVGNH
jgi:hypothetical protein